RSRRTRNPDPRKTKPHAHKNVGFVSSLGGGKRPLSVANGERRPSDVAPRAAGRRTAADNVIACNGFRPAAAILFASPAPPDAANDASFD
ncbi:hypothetical protein, partial [Burkholderia pseudomallei]|uniref:hypothetical protein n=1 Tax=Burkholderia pseudomallei TaxID=28450 RepID=UPI001C83C766